MISYRMICVPSNVGKNKENVVYIHIGTLLICKEEQDCFFFFFRK